MLPPAYPVLLFVCTLAVLSPSPAWTQEVGTIVETALPADGDPTGRWAEVIRETVRLRLATSGLPEEVLHPLPPPEDGSVGSFLDAAAGVDNATLAIVSDYDIEGNRIEMDLSLYDVETQELIASDSRDGRLDLDLDEVILEAVDSVLAMAAVLLGLSPEVFGQQPERVAESLGPGDNADTAGISRDTDVDRDTSPDPDAGGDEASQSSGAERRTEKPRRMQLLCGASPFIASGASGEYFSLGIRPVLNLVFAIPLPTGEVGAGLLIEGNRMAAEGTLGSGITYLGSVAPEVRYQSASSNTLSIFARLAIGASFLYFSSENGEKLQEVIPYGSTGVGAGFLFTERFGIVAETSFAIYFEGEEPIMGFAPTLQLMWRL